MVPVSRMCSRSLTHPSIAPIAMRICRYRIRVDPDKKSVSAPRADADEVDPAVLQGREHTVDAAIVRCAAQRARGMILFVYAWLFR